MAAMDEKLKSSKNCLNSTTSSIKTAHFEQVLPSISRLVLEKSILRSIELLYFSYFIYVLIIVTELLKERVIIQRARIVEDS